MRFINLTPDPIRVFKPEQFRGLDLTDPENMTADGVQGDPILDLPSGWPEATIATSPVEVDPIEGIPIVEIAYGEDIGLPENVNQDDVLIVSLPMQSMAMLTGHPNAWQMVSPYKVVRSRENGSDGSIDALLKAVKSPGDYAIIRSHENGSTVLGCMGFVR